MKICIAGSRGYADLAAVARYVEELPAGAVVVTGGAAGVDRAAENAARRRGLRWERWAADWQQGRRAGPLRNRLMVAACDGVAIFWDGSSAGTRSTLSEARKAGKLVYLEISEAPGSLWG